MKNCKLITSFLTSDRLVDLTALFLRLFVGVMMLTHGIEKIMHFSTLESTFPDPIGLGSKWSLVMIILCEAGCSALLVLGMFTRLAVLPLIFSMTIAAFFSFPEVKMGTAELPLMYMGIYVAIGLLGPGRYSADRCLCRFIQRRCPYCVSSDSDKHCQ